MLEFLTGTEWTPLFSEKHFGILPLVAGTLLVSGIAVVVALPAGLLLAIYLSEYAPAGVRRVVKPLLEVLAGVPTVVYGYFALLFVTPLLQRVHSRPGRIQRAGSGHRDGDHDPPAGLIAVRGRVACGARRAAGRRVCAGLHAGCKPPCAWWCRRRSPASPAAFILAVSRAIGETMIVAIAAGQQPRFTRESARADRDDDRVYRPGQPRRHACRHPRVQDHLRRRHAPCS